MISYYYSKCRGCALIFVVIITILGLLLIAEAEAATIIVPDNYPTIQQAVNNAATGDTIFVRSGVYHENVVINKNLKIEGEDRKTTVIDGKGSDSVRINNAEIEISGFTITNGKTGINFFSTGPLTIKDSTIENNNGYGIEFSYGSSYANGDVTVERSIIRNNMGRGLSIYLNSYNATLRDNLIENNTDYGIYIRGANIRHNPKIQ